MLIKLLSLAAAVFLAGCAVSYTPKMDQHIKGSVFKATDTGYYTTELVLKPSPPVVGANTAQLIIHDYEAEDIPGLKITCSLYLPAKKLSPVTQPKVTDAGRGLYLIENMHFPEPGAWEIKLTIKGPFKTDTVVLQIPEVK